jgi:hypothetical protein
MIKILRKYVMSNDHLHYSKMWSYIHIHVYILIFFWLYSPLYLSFLYTNALPLFTWHLSIGFLTYTISRRVSWPRAQLPNCRTRSKLSSSQLQTSVARIILPEAYAPYTVMLRVIKATTTVSCYILRGPAGRIVPGYVYKLVRVRLLKLLDSLSKRMLGLHTSYILSSAK